MALSPADFDLVARYQNEKHSTEMRRGQIVEVHRRSKSQKKFYIFFSVLAIAPFVIAGVFAYDAAKINNTLNVSGFNQLRKSLSAKNYNTLSHQAGLQPVATAANTYDHRYIIIGLIFSVFLLIMALTLIGRMVVTYTRSIHE